MIARPKSAADPRIERSRQVILQAVLDELGEAGYGALAIESVARRAGVGKATIYRHWPDKIALIADAFKLLQQQRDPELVTGTPRQCRRRFTLLVLSSGSHRGSGARSCSAEVSSSFPGRGVQTSHRADRPRGRYRRLPVWHPSGDRSVRAARRDLLLPIDDEHAIRSGASSRLDRQCLRLEQLIDMATVPLIPHSANSDPMSGTCACRKTTGAAPARACRGDFRGFAPALLRNRRARRRSLQRVLSS